MSSRAVPYVHACSGSLPQSINGARARGNLQRREAAQYTENTLKVKKIKPYRRLWMLCEKMHNIWCNCANRKDPPRCAPGGSFRLAVGIGLRLSTLVAPANQLDSFSSDARSRAEALSLSHLT